MAARAHVTITPFPEESADSMLRRLKKAALKEGHFREMKKRAYYEKPSLRKRRKSAEARKKLAKAARRRAEYEPRDV